jgi:FtsP/CotA-like multicopper oxidase with cupredoxin domain
VPSDTVHATHIDGGDQFTNLHFHGLHVTPRMRRERGIHVFGDNVLLNLPPGESRFSFRIPKYHPQGTYWYHSHRHECTDDQVYRGLAGLMLIGDARKALPARFHKVRTRSLALKDIQVVKDGDRWAIPGLHDWANPTHRTVNGLVDPTMKMRPDETQLWRVLNASAGVWYVLALVDPANNDARDTFQVVATDGHRRESPATETQVLIPPGQRFDLLVRAPATGQRVLKTLQFNQGRRTMPEDVLATIDVAGPRALLLDPATPVGTPVAFPKKRGPDRQFVFTIGISTRILPAFRINGKVFDANRVDAAPTLDTYERWTLVNKSTEWHPFHIHQNDFRVVSINGNPPPAIEQDQRDIVALPPIRGRKPGVVVIDVPFTDFSGRFVFHCHILDHEDRGMMALVDVRKPRS